MRAGGGATSGSGERSWISFVGSPGAAGGARRVRIGEGGEGEGGGVPAVGAHGLRRRAAAAFAEESSDGRTGDEEVGDLPDRGDRGEARIDAGAEGAGSLSALDDVAEPLEEPGRDLGDLRDRVCGVVIDHLAHEEPGRVWSRGHELEEEADEGLELGSGRERGAEALEPPDRKSTRLNSSHLVIS